MMGHADIQTTMRYVHYVPQHNAADRLTSLVSEATGGHVGGTTEAQTEGRQSVLDPFRTAKAVCWPRPRSSTGQSEGLLIPRLQVRVLPGAPRKPHSQAGNGPPRAVPRFVPPL